MYSNLNFSLSSRLTTFLLAATFSIICAFGANQVKADDDPGFCKSVTGDNYCYMTRAYIPKAELSAKLPSNMSIPTDAEMAEYFPDTPLQANAHPVMISVCRGTNIADVYTLEVLPAQEETMILIPVMFTYDWPYDCIREMSSYCPVLYLDTEEGVEGGDFFGLRKEYHPEITTVVTDTTKTSSQAGNEQWPDVLNVEYEQTGDDLGPDGLDNFFEQLFTLAYSSLSYDNDYSYMRAGVFPNEVKAAEEIVNWTWEGMSITDSDDMMSQFSQYYYAMSWPLSANKAFFHTSSPGDPEVNGPGSFFPLCK